MHADRLLSLNSAYAEGLGRFLCLTAFGMNGLTSLPRGTT